MYIYNGQLLSVLPHKASSVIWVIFMHYEKKFVFVRPCVVIKYFFGSFPVSLAPPLCCKKSHDPENVRSMPHDNFIILLITPLVTQPVCDSGFPSDLASQASQEPGPTGITKCSQQKETTPPVESLHKSHRPSEPISAGQSDLVGSLAHTSKVRVWQLRTGGRPGGSGRGRRGPGSTDLVKIPWRWQQS